MSRFAIRTVYLLCSGMNNDFHAPRLIALRGGDRNEETPATENEREVLIRRACARTLNPRSFKLLERSLQPHAHPFLWTSLMAPAWRLLHVSR